MPCLHYTYDPLEDLRRFSLALEFALVWDGMVCVPTRRPRTHPCYSIFLPPLTCRPRALVPSCPRACAGAVPACIVPAPVSEPRVLLTVPHCTVPFCAWLLLRCMDVFACFCLHAISIGNPGRRLRAYRRVDRAGHGERFGEK
jgi:hypothetical protein